jgi:hypothetical protein
LQQLRETKANEGCCVRCNFHSIFIHVNSKWPWLYEYCKTLGITEFLDLSFLW